MNGGYAFRFQPRQIAAPQYEEPAVEEMSAPEDDLVNIGNLTNNYYQSYSRLKDFVSEMGKKGVDVTKPDFRQPGGGALHQAFQKLDASLRLSANDLKQRKEQIAEERKAILEGKGRYTPGFDPTSEESMGSLQDYYSPNKLLPEVEQAQDMINKLYGTPDGAQRANQLIDPLREELRAKLADPNLSAGEKQFIQMNLNALRGTNYETPASTVNKQLDINAKRTAARGKNQAAFDLMKKFVSDANRGGDPEAYTTKLTPEGDILKIKEADWSGLKFGASPEEKLRDRIGDHIEVDDAGRVTLHFKPATNEDGDQVTPKSLELHTMRPNEIINLIATHNPKLIDPNKAYQFLSEGGFIDDLGFASTEGFLGEEGMQQLQSKQEKLETERAAQKAAVDSETSKLRTVLQNDREVSYFLNDKKITFKPHKLGSGLYLTSADFEHITGRKPKNNEHEHLKADAILRLLRQGKYFDRVLKQTTQSTVNQPTAPKKSKFIP